VQERDGAAAGAGEEEGQQPVQETGHPAQNHAQAEASGRLEMLAIGLADGGRMIGEEIVRHDSPRLVTQPP
jgi:hypothetical protein